MWASAPQTPPNTFTNAAALLDAVAKAYAADAETFRMESITESVSSQEKTGDCPAGRTAGDVQSRSYHPRTSAAWAAPLNSTRSTVMSSF